ncbi:MAG: hypothetical protein PHP59_12635 [Methanofollis sp.]|uniref:hypothetical protein n=1 Tax=Methanofollis sp. TaxID=2052835 RepID=UPI00262DB9F0|nr:hypothetical protein [Methanofollis sp.]MDD4256204.1 hypothetical protein [Methanofollis sp.]
MAPPLRSEWKRKTRAMRRGIDQGWAEGALLGRVPILSPLLGAIRGWYRTTITLFKEDLAS